MKHYFDKNNNEYPCNSCDTGWGSYGSGIDKKGKFIEIKSCRDNCEILKIWFKKKFINKVQSK